MTLERGAFMITNMTEGSVAKMLWKFSIPMLISVMFQQFYSIADTVIAGTYINSDALAAVGASYPITMIFIAVATGINIGTSVIISQLFGAGHINKMKTAVSTSVITTVILSVIVTAIGALFCDSMIDMLDTPAKIFSDSSLYLKIYIWGILFLFIYNVSNGIFVALGDSRTPLYFLVASSVGNVILDFVFVKYFDMKIAGVAWATFIAQGISSVISVSVLLIRMKKVKCNGNYKKYSFGMLKKIARIAVPSILQQSFISVGNLFIQSKVNSFGENVIAGYTAAIKLNTFSITSLTTLANAISSFTAQNLGAGKTDRVKRGFKVGCIMLWSVCVVFMLIFILFKSQIIELFIDEYNAKIVNVGSTFLLITTPFYPIVTIKFVCDAILRGAGAMTAFMISTLTDFILRVTLAFILSVPFNETGIWLSWPIGWCIASVLSFMFYKMGRWKKFVR